MDHARLLTVVRNWDDYIRCVEEVAGTAAFQRIRDAILGRAAISKSDRVADIGAGTGLLSIPAAERAEHVWAVDLSAEMSNYLRARAEGVALDNLEPVTQSVVSLPFAGASVDVVLSNYCFHHLDEEAKLVALQELYRVLGPGGRFVFGDLMSFLDWDDPSRDGRPGVLRNGRGALNNAAHWLRGCWERPQSADWWRRALPEVGFRGVSVARFDEETGIGFARR